MATTDHTKDRFSQSPESYLKSHDIVAHVSHALATLLSVRDADTKINPFRYMSEYFTRISNGEHVINQNYSYIQSTQHNRSAFIKLFWRSFKAIGCRGDMLTAKEYHSLIELLCPDFPFSLIQSAARIILMDDAIADCLISFADFLYAFQVQFYYDEFLWKCKEQYLSLSADDKLDGVESSQLLEAITTTFTSSCVPHPPLRPLTRILTKSNKISFYTFLLGISNSDSINSYIGALPKKSLCLETSPSFEGIASQI